MSLFKRKPVRGARALVGCRVKLLREVATTGGRLFPAGVEATVGQTWRGMFHLDFSDGGCIRNVSRNAFEVLP